MNKYAVELIKLSEGFRSAPYLCPAGFWTIGYGTRCSKDHKEITKEEAVQLLEVHLKKDEQSVFRLCPILAGESEQRQGAIIDFVYNLGSGRLQQSTLRRRINQANWSEVRKELMKWVYGGGKKLPGLVLRRKAESLLI
jgi:lysozyme